MRTVRIVCRPTLAAGFQLAGLSVVDAADPDGAADAIRRLATEPDAGIVLVDDALYQRLPRDLVSRLDRRALPIVTPVPGPHWDERRAADAYVTDILRQAIGYRVRAR